ncbi:hypothetical protein DFJ74DRAFT_656484 [Hyaloraphidium curvatum]|nr:hypothetical protein DFJ74DRAFT_656484 [Hyaloraphidium curvatum]
MLKVSRLASPRLLASFRGTRQMANSVFPRVPDPPGYVFPRSKLRTSLQDPSKEPLVILACGSYSPITYLHLRMFEMARDYVVDFMPQYEVVGGYFSPVGDGYGKKGLAAGDHRVRMLELATASSPWLMVDPWEALIKDYTKTAFVMDHVEDEVNRDSQLGRPVKVMLLAGADLIESFGVPDLWATDHLHHICGRFGCLIIDREGSDAADFMMTSDVLYQHRTNVRFIRQYVRNDISSTKVRLLTKRGLSIRYLTPDPVVDYIAQHELYR